MLAAQTTAILDALLVQNISVSDFLLHLLDSPYFSRHPSTVELAKRTPEIIAAFFRHPTSSSLALAWAHKTIKYVYSKAIANLSRKENGWHFSALHASAKQLTTFNINKMADEMYRLEPELWELVEMMLTGDSKATQGMREIEQVHNHDIHMRDVAELDEEELYWANQEEIMLEDGDSEPGQRALYHGQNHAGERRRALVKIVRFMPAINCHLDDMIGLTHLPCKQKQVNVISILMQGRNQKCNAFQSVNGLFLRSANTPEKVIKTLAHMGNSISLGAIHSAVNSLSNESEDALIAQGQTLLTLWAYDNFDVDLKVLVPTVEKQQDTLTHLTSATLIRLEHGVKLEDLRCSEYLWQRSLLNPNRDRHLLPPRPSMDALEKLHPEADHPSGLTRRERFNAWKFRSDLILHGPLYFKKFSGVLGQPEVVDQIPVTKMVQIPARAMDINPGNINGNIQVIPEILAQGGVGNPKDPECRVQDPVDIAQYVSLWAGDLGTAEHVLAVLRRSSNEHTPWDRYQYIVFVMGLFHLKMACADALWRIFIQPKEARKDPNSLMAFVAQHRPKETGKITSKPGYRRMHEVIGHDGITL